MIVRRVTVRGRVQGVGYRAWVAHTAGSLKLEGWVRNRGDGSVEAVFAGAESVVGAMIAQCRRGPASAHVTHVAEETAADEQLKLRHNGEDFSVLSTL